MRLHWTTTAERNEHQFLPDRTPSWNACYEGRGREDSLPYTLVIITYTSSTLFLIPLGQYSHPSGFVSFSFAFLFNSPSQLFLVGSSYKHVRPVALDTDGRRCRWRVNVTLCFAVEGLTQLVRIFGQESTELCTKSLAGPSTCRVQARSGGRARCPRDDRTNEQMLGNSWKKRGKRNWTVLACRHGGYLPLFKVKVGRATPRSNDLEVHSVLSDFRTTLNRPVPVVVSSLARPKRYRKARQQVLSDLECEIGSNFLLRCVPQCRCQRVPHSSFRIALLGQWNRIPVLAQSDRNDSADPPIVAGSKQRRRQSAECVVNIAAMSTVWIISINRARTALFAHAYSSKCSMVVFIHYRIAVALPIVPRHHFKSSALETLHFIVCIVLRFGRNFDMSSYLHNKQPCLFGVCSRRVCVATNKTVRRDFKTITFYYVFNVFVCLFEACVRSAICRLFGATRSNEWRRRPLSSNNLTLIIHIIFIEL